MSSTPIMKAFWRNAALLAVSLLPFSSANAVALQAKQYGDFDRYVLALSLSLIHISEPTRPY